MGMEIKQSLRLSQQLVMTPQLQQAIKLLQLNRLELAESITQELMENPVLEETMDVAESPPETPQEMQSPEAEVEAPAPANESTDTNRENEMNWEAYLEEQFTPGSKAPSMRETPEDLRTTENTMTRSTTLEEHLQWQLSMCHLAPDELKFSLSIVGNLNDDGYLAADVAELAKEVGLELEDALEVLKIIQTLDPVGVASRNLQDCLLAQARMMQPRDSVVEKILEDHLPFLERKNPPAIAKAMGLDLAEVHRAMRVILEFEPKPGRSFHTGDTHYITPDIYVYKVGGEYVISLNEEGIPKLKISPYYKDLLSSSAKVTKEYIQEKLRNAVWLIRSLHNRQKTIYKVTEAIVRRQKEFFEVGVSALRPMILKDVANDVGMHESTVSRVTTNKYVHTPVGMFELKFFFNSSINAADGTESLASEAVKDKIRQLVSKEDPRNPLSDQKLVEILKTENIDIARRTVAKYREMLGILSSSQRKQVM